jgi:hypothetical protein
MKRVTLDVRVDCAKFVESTTQRNLDREIAEVERIVAAALSGRGYFDVEVVARAVKS